LGTAVVVASPVVGDSEDIASKNKDESCIYLLADKKTRPAITYYTGYGWERAGQITKMKSWQRYLDDFKERIDNQVIVKFAD
jgi:hypothetical protein